MKGYLGVDVGSVSTNLVIIDNQDLVLENLYIRTQGQPIKAIKDGLRSISGNLPAGFEIRGVGVTGSARTLAGVVVGADIVKNEITAHAVAASKVVPEAQTIFEIGGQDSKIIILRNGIVVDFAMNTVCAAGTGSFLDQQAGRLNIRIEEFGKYALKSKTPIRIAGRCTVFAESDMIHKQQMGYNLEDIIAGLCEALVRNYLNNIGKGKDIRPPVVFQGGVAANEGIRAAFEIALGYKLIIPEYYNVMGAVGAALLARGEVKKLGKTSFKGFQTSEMDYHASSFECKGCPNMCEVINIHVNNNVIARWGDRCGKWETMAG
jgi:predicted CoA-substrate-specific enzyme activase